MFRAILACVLVAASASAQTAGTAAFRVYQRGVQVGTVETWVTRVDGNWHVQSTSRVGGTLNVAYKQLELRYDAAWRGRFMTMEVERPLAPSGTAENDRMIVHVSVGRNTTRTDIVRGKEARFRSHSVSPDTIFLPDGAFGAYEAVAARLASAKPGMDLPLFNVPISETRGAIEAVVDDSLRTKSGTIAVKRYTLLEIRSQPTTVEIWVDRGRLARLDVPRDGLSVVRNDLIR